MIKPASQDNSAEEQPNEESDANGKQGKSHIVNPHVRLAIDQLSGNESSDAAESFDTFCAWTRSPVGSGSGRS